MKGWEWGSKLWKVGTEGSEIKSSSFAKTAEKSTRSLKTLTGAARYTSRSDPEKFTGVAERRMKAPQDANTPNMKAKMMKKKSLNSKLINRRWWTETRSAWAVRTWATLQQSVTKTPTSSSVKKWRPSSQGSRRTTRKRKARNMRWGWSSGKRCCNNWASTKNKTPSQHLRAMKFTQKRKSRNMCPPLSKKRDGKTRATKKTKSWKYGTFAMKFIGKLNSLETFRKKRPRTLINYDKKMQYNLKFHNS